MDKNVRTDIEIFFSNHFFNILSIVVVGGAAMITSYIPSIQPITIGLLILTFVFILIFYLKIRKWRKRKENGFVSVQGKSDNVGIGEKLLWLDIDQKDKFEKTKCVVYLKRFTLGTDIDSPDLTRIKEDRKIVSEDIDIDISSKNIIFAKGIEDEVWILLKDLQFPLKIVTPWKTDENYLQEFHEVVFEIEGKINDRFVFSEMYKGIFSYTCTKEPNLFKGEDGQWYRTVEIKWVEPLKKWSKNEEAERNKLHEIELAKHLKTTI